MSTEKLVMPKIVDWDGSDIIGPCRLTIKLDGVRGIWDGKSWTSRAGKPLYNIPPAKTIGTYEIYLGSYKDTIVATRTQFPNSTTPKIEENHLYQLWPEIDIRIFIRNYDGVLTPKTIIEYRDNIIDSGYEGLVIRTSNIWHKVKSLYTIDIPITDAIAGKGKHEGRLGALVTDYGKVGTGFDDEERINFWLMHQRNELIGKIIEVVFMEYTSENKLRHPRFIRLRDDK